MTKPKYIVILGQKMRVHSSNEQNRLTDGQTVGGMEGHQQTITINPIFFQKVQI